MSETNDSPEIRIKKILFNHYADVYTMDQGAARISELIGFEVNQYRTALKKKIEEMYSLDPNTGRNEMIKRFLKIIEE